MLRLHNSIHASFKPLATFRVLACSGLFLFGSNALAIPPPYDKRIDLQVPVSLCEERKVVIPPELKPGEILKSIVCIKNRIFVLTDLSLRVFSSDPKSMEKGTSLKIISHSTITDLSSFCTSVVSWLPTYDKVYLLSNDRKLFVLSAHSPDTEASEFRVPFEVKEAKMFFYKGFLFVSVGLNKLEALSLGDRLSSKEFVFSSLPSDSEFFEAGSKLYFGKAHVKVVEVNVSGNSLGAISVK